jgi:hypothetical protein
LYKTNNLNFVPRDKNSDSTENSVHNKNLGAVHYRDNIKNDNSLPRQFFGYFSRIPIVIKNVQ